MTQIRFNIIQIIIILITIIGSLLIAVIIWKLLKAKAKVVAIICVSLLLILGAGVSVFVGFGIVERERSVIGTVVSVEDKALPVFMGPNRAYTIFIEEETESIWGEVDYSFTTDAFSSKKLQTIVSNVKPGDRVLLKYNRWHDLYYCEILNSDDNIP